MRYFENSYGIVSGNSLFLADFRGSCLRYDVSYAIVVAMLTKIPTRLSFCCPFLD